MYVLSERWNETGETLISLSFSKEEATNIFKSRVRELLVKNTGLSKSEIEAIIINSLKENYCHEFIGYRETNEELDVSLFVTEYSGGWVGIL